MHEKSTKIKEAKRTLKFIFIAAQPELYKYSINIKLLRRSEENENEESRFFIMLRIFPIRSLRIK